jgi:hypothetical protein
MSYIEGILRSVIIEKIFPKTVDKVIVVVLLLPCQIERLYAEIN